MNTYTAGPRRASDRPGGSQLIHSWRSNSGEVRGDQRVTAIVGICCAVIGVIVALIGRNTTVAVFVGLVTLCVTPGCAFVCWHLTRDRLGRALAVLAASMTWSVLVATVFAWLQVTALGPLLAATAGVGGIGSLIFLFTRGSDELEYESGLTGDATEQRQGGRPVSRQPLSPRSPRIIATVALVAATGLLAAAIMKAHGHSVGNYGLLPLLGIPFFAAVALTIGTAVLTLWFVRTARLWAIVALGLLLVELTGTQMILDATPLTSWAYKHFGVVDLVFHGGVLNDPLDVYQQWPGFFAVAAGLVHLSGRSSMSYSNWAELFFQVLNSVTLFAIARHFSKRRRLIPYLTVLLFVTANWEGQQYFSPQTMDFQLALLFQLLLLPLIQTDQLRRPFRNWSWFQVQPLDFMSDGPLNKIGQTARVIGLVALFGAIVVTHQLSPYIVFAGVAALWILGVLRHPVVVLILGAILLIYPALHLSAVQQNSPLHALDFSNATGTKGFAVLSPQQVFGSDLAKIVCVGFWGGTAICGLSYRRRIGAVIIPLILAAMPLSLVLVSNYGGEGIFRSFLFSSPWCALIITIRMADLRRAPRLRLIVVGCWVLFTALASAQASEFGMYGLLLVQQGEISASQYFLDHAPMNATLVLGATNYPSRLNQNYVLHNATQTPNDPGLDDYPQFLGTGLERTSPESLAQSVTNIGKGSGYLVIGPSMYAYNEYYNTFAPNTLQDLVQRLQKSSYWKLWYKNDGTFIFEALPHGQAASSGAKHAALKK